MQNLYRLIAVAYFLLGVAGAAQAQQNGEMLPLSTSTSPSMQQEKPLTIAQQRARYAADQRMFRAEWNQWIGYEPLRPTVNASYMSNGVQRFYIPSRGVIVSTGVTRAWYW